ncbi:MAG: hypothetical protein LBE46_04850 [Wolbachia pipientis]|jgi:hypothetical protein|nr:hypothetical protein [Wolbachia pipientis]
MNVRTAMWGSLGVTIGQFVGCILGFTSLSPFAVCSIAAVVSTTVLYCLMYLLCSFFKIFDKSASQKQSDFWFFSAEYIFDIVIGIGLGVAANAIPGVTLDIELAAALGGLIGVAAPILAEKVNHYIIEPIVEKVKGCFSSKEA